MGEYSTDWRHAILGGLGSVWYLDHSRNGRLHEAIQGCLQPIGRRDGWWFVDPRVGRIDFNSGLLLIVSGVDSSLYTGDINWIDIPSSQRDYWRIPLEGMMVQGNNIDITVSPLYTLSTSLTSSLAQANPLLPSTLEPP